MLKLFISLLLLAPLFFLSCAKQNKKEVAEAISNVEQKDTIIGCIDKGQRIDIDTNAQINLPDSIFFDNKFEDLDVEGSAASALTINQDTYDKLQLSNIEAFAYYSKDNFIVNKTLYEGENGKIISIYVITGGEVMEYLFSYDKDGKLKDSLLVAYTDNVEYFSTITSKLKSGKMIAVETINFSYDEANTTDTITTWYNITPELKFQEQD